ncbi:hypothetical protein [Streptomyces sp. STCH 565 A]|uniref:hypothetical protein n=1 Tax=Streptomyces sp. STCH 565 A TaxID=2950532 RepID=UPI002074ADC7|nr:hypothetical protein [Streptomyces sp. STCH 565 A]MCM8548807.1 hypothetical protein [Streptomyces sp. STCH 565 A]
MSEVRGITVTIKYGKSYEDTWAVFKGGAGEVRQDILDYFGIESDSVTGLTLSDIVTNATQIAHGKGLIATQLGATVIAQEPAPAPAKPQGDPWASVGTSQPVTVADQAPASSSEQDKNTWILGEIEKQTNRADLKKLWANNQSFFADPAVMTAYKAKGKALPA